MSLFYVNGEGGFAAKTIAYFYVGYSEVFTVQSIESAMKIS